METDGCTTVRDIAKDASIANTQNTDTGNKTALNADLKAESTAPHAKAKAKFVATFSYLLLGRPTQQSTSLKGWDYHLT